MSRSAWARAGDGERHAHVHVDEDGIIRLLTSSAPTGTAGEPIGG